MGDRTAFTTSNVAIERALPSTYLKRFRQGATIVPRNFYFVSLDENERPIEQDAYYIARTDGEQAKDAKAPYKEIILQGNVEGLFLFQTAISKNVLPFLVIDPAIVVLPVVIQKSGTRLVTPDELNEMGYRHAGAWMRRASEHWDKHRGGKADRQTLYQRLDYQKGLTNQDLSAPYLVLYNAAGTNLSAAVFVRKAWPQTFFAEHKLYYYATRDRGEADYLVSILNSSIVNELIKPFQSVGLQGERDIEKKVLELPIPVFDAKKPEHAALAKLGAEAGKHAAKVVASAKSEGWPDGLARRRAILRTNLADVLSQIDQAVRALFGIPAD
jgi:hypothetical protein